MKTLQTAIECLWPSVKRYTTGGFCLADALLMDRKHAIEVKAWNSRDEAYFMVVMYLSEELKDKARDMFGSLAKTVDLYQGNRIPLGLEFEGNYSVDGLWQCIDEERVRDIHRVKNDYSNVG